MKQLLGAIGILLLLAAAAAGWAFFTAAGQHALIRAATSARAAPPAVPLEPGLHVVVCGSASPLGRDPNRAQACIAVLTPDHFLLFDVGAGSPAQITRAGLPIARLQGVFLTHFHSDHIADLPDVSLTSWVQGRQTPLPVHGPQGVTEVVEGMNAAYRQDRNHRLAHHGDTLLMPGAGAMLARPFTAYGVIWQQGGLTVSAAPAAHPPIDPAVAYRVDYRGRSVVISGDSNAAASVFELAENADLLLHDALSRALIDPMIEGAENAGSRVMPQIMRDVIDYHADTLSLPEPAAAAGVRQLAYYHLVPVPTNALAERLFRRGLPDEVILVRDLDRIHLAPDSTDITWVRP